MRPPRLTPPRIARTPAAFRRAIDGHELVEVALPARTLPSSLLVGEAHGLHAAATPAVVHALAGALDARAFGFEWSHEELDEPLAELMHRGRLDVERLWALPEDAEVFSGDGRFTAGHVALLERLWAEGRLGQVIAFDRLDPQPLPPPPARDAEMAERLARLWDRRLPLVALVGAAHAVSEPGTMASALDLPTAMLDYGERVSMPYAALRLRVPAGPSAVVPGR